MLCTSQHMHGPLKYSGGLLGVRNITPGRMHDLRSASVNNTRMSCAAAKQRLHTFLRYMSAQLFGDIVRFMTGLQASVRKNKLAMLNANFAQLKHRPLGPDGEVKHFYSHMNLLIACNGSCSMQELVDSLSCLSANVRLEHMQDISAALTECSSC